MIVAPLPTDPRPAAVSPLRGLRVALVGPGSSSIQTSLLATGLKLDGARVVRVACESPVHLAAARLPYVRDRLQAAKFRAALGSAVTQGADVVHVEAAANAESASVLACVLAAAHDAETRVVVRLLATPSAEVASALAAADGIVVPTPYLRDRLRSTFGLVATWIRHIAEDSGLDAPPVRTEGRLRLLCARPLEPQHGVDVVLDAVARAAASGTDLELTVAGDGPERAALERRAERTLAGRVTFAGALPRDYVLCALRETDAVLDASVADDFPAGIDDALAAGVPVACGAAPGVAWAVDHAETGLVTPVGDAAAMAESIARLDRDRAEAIAFGWRAKIRALRRTWDAVRGDWAAAYGVTAGA